jgi:serine/threonine-protein kinase
LEQCDNTIALNPLFPAAYWLLGLVQEQRGEADEAAAAFQRAIQLAPKSPRMQAAVGRAFARAGERKKALRILGELKELAKERYVSPFELACVNFALEEEDAGYQWLEKAFADRCFELIWLKVDPRFDSIKGNQRFQGLLDRLGLD